MFTFLIDRICNFGNVLGIRFNISAGQILNEMVDSINLIVIILSGSLDRVALLLLLSKRQDKNGEEKLLKVLFEVFIRKISCYDY